MLGEGCPRPQEIVRQYAEKSNASLSGLNENSHPHHHPHHRQFSGSNDHLSSSRNPFRTISNHFVGCGSPYCYHHPHSHPHHHLYEHQHNGVIPLKHEHDRCRICFQLFMNHGSLHQRSRSRRLSSPANLKLREWFNTINHKWARIKRQVILYHHRQQPLINEDNYDTNGRR